MRKSGIAGREFAQISFLALTMYFLIVVNIHAGGDITKGMIGYWPLDGDAKDVSGNDYHGELTKGVKWKANGKVGGAASFDGEGSHIKVAQKDLAPQVLNFTVVTWINGYKAKPGQPSFRLGVTEGRLIGWAIMVALTP